MADVRIVPIRPLGADFDVDGFIEAVKKDARQIAADGKRFIATYPPQVLVKTGYVRTNTLKRSWSSKTRSTRLEITVEIGSNANIAPYNRVVQGDPQGKLFAGANWRNVDDLEKKGRSDAEKRVQATLDRLAR
ncbi:hypothetical protein LCGC14_2799060 [marine sediment metagenome]|uniref:HK97 gp10 family phage protein n=1 Tax=marine sediment metagenome TaxID=412755 RepID=A0A0F8YNE9_9ZZZZ